MRSFKSALLSAVTIVAVVPALSATPLAAETSAAVRVTSSGTETVSAQSGWYDTVGEAEAALYDLLDDRADQVESRLESSGKRVIGHSRSSADCDEREPDSGSVTYSCSGSVDINWVSDDEVSANRSGLAAGLTHKIGQKGTFASDQSGTAPDAAADQSFPVERVVIENYLLDQFKKKYGKNYDELTLDSIAVAYSDLTVGDVISQLPQSVSTETYEFSNGSSSEQSLSVNLGVTALEREKYNFRKQVVTGRKETYTVKVSGEYKFGSIGSVGAEASAQTEKTRTVTLGSDSETERSVTRKFEENFTQKVPAKTLMFVKVQREITNNVYALRGGVTFDGQVTVVRKWKDVYACGPFGTSRCSRTKSSSTPVQLSQILTDAQRTIDMSGEVLVSSAANTKTKMSWAEQPISSIPAQASALMDAAETAGLDSSVFLPGKNYRKIEAAPPGLTWHTK